MRHVTTVRRIPEARVVGTHLGKQYCKVSLGVASLSLLVKAEKLNRKWLSSSAAAGGGGTEQIALGQPRQAGRLSPKLLDPRPTLQTPTVAPGGQISWKPQCVRCSVVSDSL